MGPIESFSERRKDCPLVEVGVAQQLIDECGNQVGAAGLGFLAENGLLPKFGSENPRFLREDIRSWRGIAVVGESSEPATELWTKAQTTEVCVGHNMWVSLRDLAADKLSPAMRPGFRHLVGIASIGQPATKDHARKVPWLEGISIWTSNRAVEGEARAQVARAARVDAVGTTDFARTAYYMGTKRELASFLVEAIATTLPPDGTILDLMCGSGAASGAFARNWRTYASDAQRFCQHLAHVQGGGYTVGRAEHTLASILGLARAHDAELSMRVSDFLAEESRLCHSDVTPELCEEFVRYQTSLPRYPNDIGGSTWDPVREVNLRKVQPREKPYCLFTSYFAGLFVGLRQAIEIDSIRYAIDSLAEEVDRRWALGALVVATSVRATTYAAHFAQPRIRDVHALSGTQIEKILEKWTGSVYHEFAIRLRSLAQQSTLAEFSVDLIGGPWQNALDEFRQYSDGHPATVYLDPPYTREEYSRYYHVLETLVAYHYPSATGRGKVPAKRAGESFASEFFTRSSSAMNRHLVAIVSRILAEGWTCAWSYADNGQADIERVITDVSAGRECRVESFVAPHRHISQSGRPPKSVAERLILFSPAAK